jgi:hypothetical protein
MFLVRHHVAVVSKLLDQGEPVELTEYVRHQGRSLPVRKLEYVFAISVGGILRTDDPFGVKAVQHTNATNGSLRHGNGVVTFGKKLAFLVNADRRGAHAQKYGQDGIHLTGKPDSQRCR